jgi:Domain of unknown function (DUF4850)
MRKLVFALALCLLCAIVGFAQSADFAALASVNAERAAELKISALSPQNSVPAILVQAQTGLDLAPGDMRPASSPVALKLGKKSAVQWAYLIGYGWLLLPKDWRVIDAGVGANGSMILIAEAKDHSRWLEYYDTGASVGSAIDAASCDYPQAQALALAYEMGQCENADPPNPKASAIQSTQFQVKTLSHAEQQQLSFYASAPHVGYRRLRWNGPKESPDLRRTVFAQFFAAWTADR